MHNLRTFAAASLSEVIQQLLIYRPTGLLTIWPVHAPRQEEIKIIISQGQPRYLYKGTHTERFTQAMLLQIDSWGNLHFTFQTTSSLQLPAPGQTYQHNQPSGNSTARPVTHPRFPAVTQPLYAIKKPSIDTSKQAALQPGHPHIQEQKERYTLSPNPGQQQPTTEKDYYQQLLSSNGQHPYQPDLEHIIAPELVVPIHTRAGHSYPPTALPRYDRTIFLLIDGRRSVADLTQLTRRSLAEVYASLYRLHKQQLITMES